MGTRKMLTLKQAVTYLKETRGIVVSRQAIHLLVQRNKGRCREFDHGDGGRVSFWLIPVSLLDEYQPSEYHQRGGIIRAETQNNTRAAAKKS
jgi:hypothetical protein